MNVKGFSFPRDLKIFIEMPFKIKKHRRFVDEMGFNRILQEMKPMVGSGKPDISFLLYLKKNFRVVSYYLNKIFRDPNPCMIRSLVLYDICKRNNVNSHIITGVAKVEEGLEGHCWLEIDGEPFGESRPATCRYTRIKEV